LSRKLRRAGFDHLRLWRQQMILPFKDSKDFAEKMMASAPRLVAALSRAEPERQAHFQRLVERMAARVLDSERPIGLEVLLVIAQKPLEGESLDGDLGFGRDEANEPEELSSAEAEAAEDVPAPKAPAEDLPAGEAPTEEGSPYAEPPIPDDDGPDSVDDEPAAAREDSGRSGDAP
ncbi:MAG TPA: hypothetical protein PKW90_17685, partial [Myxococcota bacterium]|nr:hypothetical protein [Myxococcota bacterium]